MMGSLSRPRASYRRASREG